LILHRFSTIFYDSSKLHKETQHDQSSWSRHHRAGRDLRHRRRQASRHAVHGSPVSFRNEIAPFFRNMPIVLMSQDKDGNPHYYGRKDIVDFLKTVKVEQIPWKTYHIY